MQDRNPTAKEARELRRAERRAALVELLAPFTLELERMARELERTVDTHARTAEELERGSAARLQEAAVEARRALERLHQEATRARRRALQGAGLNPRTRALYW